jgi:ABC-2 type transport system permease protein
MSTGVDMLREVGGLTKRWFMHSLRQPIAIAAGLFQPLIWLFLFGSVFRNLRPEALQAAGDNYVSFLAAGVIIFTAFSSALASGVPVLFDKENQFLDRLLVAPLVSRFSIVIASAIHIVVMSFLQAAVVLVVAAWWGGAVILTPAVIAAVFLITALLIVGIAAFSLGCAFGMRAHFEMLSLIQVVALPAIFVSSALAPLSLMPAWLQWPASLNPLTMAIEPVRYLMLNGFGPGALRVVTPWATLGMAGCIAYLVAFDVLALGLVGWFLRRYLR